MEENALMTGAPPEPCCGPYSAPADLLAGGEGACCPSQERHLDLDLSGLGLRPSLVPPQFANSHKQQSWLSACLELNFKGVM